MSNTEKIKEILEKHPGYFKSGDINLIKLCEKHGFTLEEFKEVRKELRKTRVLTTLEKVLDNNNLELEDVKRFKIYGNVDNPMVSVHSVDDWHKKQENIILSFEKILKLNPAKHLNSHKRVNDYCAVISMQDLHLDKIALVEETGDYADINTNLATAMYGFNEILTDIVNYKPEKIVLIVGSDAFNSNDRTRKTINGTPQDEDYDWYNNFICIYKFYRMCIEAAQEHSNVHVVTIHGNHDYDKVFYLGQLLKTTFEGNKRVTVDDSRVARKYFSWGKILLGFAHGDTEKKIIRDLPSIMMIENKLDFHKYEYMEMLLGDIHHQETYQTMTTKDFRGATIRFLRAVSPIGRWEHKEGYVGIPKTIDGFIYSKSKGLKSNFQVHL